MVDKRLFGSRKRAKLVFSLLICGQALDRDGEPGDRGGDEDDHDGVDLQVEQVVGHEGDKLAPASHRQLTHSSPSSLSWRNLMLPSRCPFLIQSEL